MNKLVLLLLCAFLFLADSSKAVAGAGSPYARAKAKGHIYLHRPNYRYYNGGRRTQHSKLFQRSTRRSKAKHITPVRHRVVNRHTTL